MSERASQVWLDIVVGDDVSICSPDLSPPGAITDLDLEIHFGDPLDMAILKLSGTVEDLEAFAALLMATIREGKTMLAAES